MYARIREYLSSVNNIDEMEALWEIRERLDYLERRFDFSFDEAFSQAFDNHTVMLGDGTILQMIKSKVLKKNNIHKSCINRYVYKVANSEHLICAECLKDI